MEISDSSVGVMRKSVPVLALTIFAAFFFSFTGQAVSQNDHATEADIVVETRMQMTSVASLDGSGSIKVTFKGDTARECRQHILSEFDSSMNQVIEADEAIDFLVAFASEIDGSLYWGVTLSLTTDFLNVSLTEVADVTDGLVSQSWDSTDDLVLRMDFDGNGEGFSKVIFITQTTINTVCGALRDSTGYLFDGVMRVEHRTISFGFGSFVSPEIASGSIQEIRTPAGVVLWYSSQFEVENSTSAENESISYEQFSPIENHQVAFAILLICSFIIMRMPGQRFQKFKKLHPKRYRKYAHPKQSVRAIAVLLVVATWTLYALPFLLSPVIEGFLLYSIYFILLGPVAVMVQYTASRVVYDRSALDIPEDTVIEVRQAMAPEEESEAAGFCTVCERPIDLADELHTCEACGVEMHIECGERAQACPACGAILYPQDTRSIECRNCGESFLHAGQEDPYSIQCTRCGAFQEEVEAGKNYLIVDRDPTMAYRMMRAMGISGRAAMAITAEFPGKMREAHELGEEVDVRWFSESTTDIDNVNPHDLEGDAMETASTFLMTTKRAGLMIDGMSLLLELNGFDKVLAYVRRLNDLAVIHGSTILLHTDKSELEEEQFKRLSDEFDEIHDYL
ncbi:MAG: DUF835 domain-containing protein [Methanobacteriota archaeon]|nr:MAG: DUF835 domain-containing protein [Euryarchaeota archaeon]